MNGSDLRDDLLDVLAVGFERFHVEARRGDAEADAPVDVDGVETLGR